MLTLGEADLAFVKHWQGNNNIRDTTYASEEGIAHNRIRPIAQGRSQDLVSSLEEEFILLIGAGRRRIDVDLSNEV
jgi:hypothetical protein